MSDVFHRVRSIDVSLTESFDTVDKPWRSRKFQGCGRRAISTRMTSPVSSCKGAFFGSSKAVRVGPFRNKRSASCAHVGQPRDLAGHSFLPESGAICVTVTAYGFHFGIKGMLISIPQL